MPVEHNDYLPSSTGEACSAEAYQLLTTAYHALRSYEYGNASKELASSIADEISAFLDRPTDGQG